MTFIQHCFIRKNTTEIKNKLKELGYRHNSFDDDREWIAANHGMFISVDEGFQNLPLDDIDCGTNEELFLALAALRNDSDYMQWFVVPKTRTKQMSGCFGQTVGMDGHYEEIVGYEWYRHENKDNALTEKLNAMFQMEDDMEFLPHKATVEEIIEHFEDKK